MTKKEIPNEKILNVPNFLSISRIFLTFVIVYMIIANISLAITIPLFAIAAFTDFLDGFIARRYKLITEFGRKADMVADRFLWVGTAIAFIIAFGIRGQLTNLHGIQVVLIMSREIITAPFAIVALLQGRGIPVVRYIAKVVTFLQGFALPSVILSVFYPAFTYLSLPLSVVIAMLGFISASHFIKDQQKLKGRKYERTR
jgi:phosphatidylglycerophosphate synthase